MTKFVRLGAAAAMLLALATPAMAGGGHEKPVGGGGGMGTDVKDVKVVPKVSKTVTATLAADPRFSTLTRALKTTGLDRTLDGTTVVTLYAPTNEAFERLPSGQLADLMKPENQARLATVLQGHVVAGRVPASAIADRRIDRTLSGTDIAFALPQGGGGGMGQARPTVSGATITETDWVATNGVIHVIDRVILPQALTPVAPIDPRPAPRQPVPLP